MRNLLLISYTFPPDNTAAAVRPGQLYEYLPELGYQPYVVASSFDGGANADPRIRRVPEKQESGQRKRASRSIRWWMRNFAPYDDRLPWIPFASGAAAEVIASRHVDAIFSTSPFLASHVVALLLKRRCRVPWIADFQDPVRDNPFRRRRWFFPYDAILERLFFRFADRIVANTDTVADAWRVRYPKFAHKISVLWNSFDPREKITAASRPDRSHRLVAHVGALYGERHPGRFLAALERLDVKASDIQVRLVGPIEPELLQRLQPIFVRLTQKGILEYGNRLVDRDEALRETAEADYLLLLDLNASNAAFQLPSKLLDYVRYGKPVLAYTPKSSPVERILAECGPAFVAIDPRESEKSEEAKVATFFSLPIEQSPISPRFEERFNAHTQARNVADLLDELLEK